MAILKFGSIITEGSGSLGGQTIQHSKGGMQLRTKPIPRYNPSAAQLLIRSINLRLQAGWKDLSDQQRKIWNNLPITYGIFNSKGDKHPLSGHSLWMKFQYFPLSINKPFTSTPPPFFPAFFGPELIPNGVFGNSLYWTIDFGWNISGGHANYNKTGWNTINTPAILTNGQTYRFKFDVVSNPGNMLLAFRNSIGAQCFAPPLAGYLNLPVGSYIFDAVCTQSQTILYCWGASIGSIFSIDNLSVKVFP